MYLFLDTETTGFPNPKLSARDRAQGRACQVAFILCDENGRNLSEFTSLIAPDNWTISEGARNVHGLDDALCAQYGVKSRMAFQVFQRLAKMAKHVVAHNLDFDWKVLTMEAAAHDLEMPVFEGKRCTMKTSTELCKLPQKNRSTYKWPKLEEALPILCGRELGDGAHDAMVDTRGCRDLFFELKNRGVI